MSAGYRHQLQAAIASGLSFWCQEAKWKYTAGARRGPAQLISAARDFNGLPRPRGAGTAGALSPPPRNGEAGRSHAQCMPCPVRLQLPKSDQAVRQAGQVRQIRQIGGRIQAFPLPRDGSPSASLLHLNPSPRRSRSRAGARLRLGPACRIVTSLCSYPMHPVRLPKQSRYRKLEDPANGLASASASLNAHLSADPTTCRRDVSGYLFLFRLDYQTLPYSLQNVIRCPHSTLTAPK